MKCKRDGTPPLPTQADWEALRAAPLTPIMVSGVDMLCLLGSLQLALRHPKHTGPLSQVARVFAEELEKRIIEAAPGFKAVCAAGWNPDYDV